VAVGGARLVGIAAGQSALMRRDRFANTSETLCASNKAVSEVRQSKPLTSVIAASAAGVATSLFALAHHDFFP
jgi:hypothetical protein